MHKAIGAVVTAVLILVNLGVAGAEETPDHLLQPQRWFGSWQFQTVTEYSSCPGARTGTAEKLDVGIMLEEAGWVARERNATGQQKTFQGSAEHAVEFRLAFRSDAGSGYNLVLAKDDSISGVRVVARKTSAGACATVSRVTARKTPESASQVKFGNAEDLSISNLDPETVVAAIRANHLPDIKGCHLLALKADQKSKGKVTTRFTVGPAGSVTKAKASGFDRTLDACIQAAMSGWRFPPPTRSGNPTSADFELPILLRKHE
jgi:hypothetical protein